MDVSIFNIKKLHYLKKLCERKLASTITELVLAKRKSEKDLKPYYVKIVTYKLALKDINVKLEEIEKVSEIAI